MPQTLNVSDANMLDGIVQQMRLILPRGTQFVVLTWPERGDFGHHHHVVEAERADAVAHLEEATKIIKHRMASGVPREVAR